jgi:hypothetical protein
MVSASNISAALVSCLATCAVGGAAVAQTDLTVVNFSQVVVELQVGNQGGYLSRGQVRAADLLSYKTSPGARWRLVRSGGGAEICSFTSGDRMTIIRVNAPAPPSGWKRLQLGTNEVFLSPKLQASEAAAGRSLAFLSDRLREIDRLIPAFAKPAMGRVKFWLDLDEQGGSQAFYATRPFATSYRNFQAPMYQGIVVPNVVEFIERSFPHQPMVILHELAHAFHHQVLGTWNGELRAVFDTAKARGLYRNIPGWNGTVLSVGHAMVDEYEYFAELSEALFGRNDQYPFDARDLETYDPAGTRLVDRAWRGQLTNVDLVKNVACSL